ncbi:MAG TPA: hypothetical protein VGX16_05500, partial [Solirubrobacteraceae bacterium]|nr:hypothetical protein [Solirubrobacteraceae bacterium]
MIVRVAKAGVVLLILGAGAVAAFMAAGVSASTGALNVSGTWQSNYHCEKGWCAGSDFPDTIKLTQAEGSSTVTGTDQIGSEVVGTLKGNTLELKSACCGGYTATFSLTISADGQSWSGPGSDSNGTSGTDTAKLEGSTTTTTTSTTETSTSTTTSPPGGSLPDLQGRWTLTSTCSKGDCPAGGVTNDLEISSQDEKSGEIKGTVDGQEISGTVAESGGQVTLS